MTELIWDGKYDKDGKKVAPVRIALPFQTIETVNESTLDRKKNLDLFASGRDFEWRNRLIWGDKKYVLPSLLPEFAGKVNLIYIDPPFNIGADFSFTAEVPNEPTDPNSEVGAFFTKEPSVIEQKAYRDTWGRGLDSYIQWFYETAVALRELLTENGSVFVHIDWHVGHYVKVVLDEVFGYDHFQNEIIWQRTDPHNDARKKMGAIHDVIFWFTKAKTGALYNHDRVRVNLSPAALNEFSLLELPNGQVLSFSGNENRAGRRFKLDDATWKGSKNKFNWRGASPSQNREWSFTSAKEMDTALERGELYLRDLGKGALRCRKSYLDENKGILLQDIWTDAGRMKGGSNYATEKPEQLLERIILACSNEGDLVLDCFCGSGTTAAVSEKNGRRWITCDLGRFSIQSARKRFLSIENVKPFVIQNLGKYERQTWQAAEFDDPKDRANKELNYRKFILELYRAEPISGLVWLHGSKRGRMVHVGSVEAPVTLADVKSISAEVWKAVGKGNKSPERSAVDILGWDFALEVNEVAKQIASEANVDVAFKVIPREVLEKKAVDQGDIKFFELAAFEVKIEKKNLVAKLKLTDFVIPHPEVPEDILKAVTHWSQWIDYWAIDWDYKDDTFHNQWQNYRTRDEAKLELATEHTYEEDGEYRVVVKVIDILGNDTTKMVTVQVKDAKK